MGRSCQGIPTKTTTVKTKTTGIVFGWKLSRNLFKTTGIVFGWKLSRNLEDVRKKILEQGPEQWGAYIPPNGMSKIQFRDLASSLNGISFFLNLVYHFCKFKSYDKELK